MVEEVAVTLLMMFLALIIAKQVYEEVGPSISIEVKRLIDAAYNILLNGIKKAGQANHLEVSRCSFNPADGVTLIPRFNRVAADSLNRSGLPINWLNLHAGEGLRTDVNA